MASPRPTAEFDVEITDDHVAEFRENGFVWFDRVTTDEEIEWLGEVYDELCAVPMSGFLDTVFDVAKPYGTVKEGEPSIGQLLFPEKRVKELHETAAWRNEQRIASALLGLPTTDLQTWGHLIFKPPVHGHETPWHQDEAYWDIEFDYFALGAWMPLDDADIDNGCMWFVPGSHRNGVLPHRHVGDDPAVHILVTTADIDTSAAVPVPLRAGGASFHHPRTLHFARPNGTERRRRAWANEFQTAPIRRAEPADRPWVTEGKAALVERWTQARA